MVDKDLFLHDLAVVAILKNEGPYLKEWIDYHLLAGVDHFYLYDNESSDNQAEVAKPYVEAGLVDYFPLLGQAMQKKAYNYAINQFKFHCRYMAFIDGDEFIFPKVNGKDIVSIVDEVLSHDPNAQGLAINWHCFGSNGQKKADYTRGVLERFTRRAPNDWYFMLHGEPVGGNPHVKSISNPRMIEKGGIHSSNYFCGCHVVNEHNKVVSKFFSLPVSQDKIIINHYFSKSFEEFINIKVTRGSACRVNLDKTTWFKGYDRNEEFDDGILKYRDARAKVYQPPDNSHVEERLLSALERNLSPTLLPDTPLEFYAGKVETFLTCRAVASYLQTKLSDTAQVKLYEEAALKAILKSLQTRYTFADAGLLVQELPTLLKLPYPVVEELRKV